MREKYIDESFPPWFIFGESRDGKHVDIYDGNDIATNIPRDEAEKIIAKHNALQMVLVRAINTFPADEQWKVLDALRSRAGEGS